jgi:hypothetical protein
MIELRTEVVLASVEDTMREESDVSILCDNQSRVGFVDTFARHLDGTERGKSRREG